MYKKVVQNCVLTVDDKGPLETPVFCHFQRTRKNVNQWEYLSGLSENGIRLKSKTTKILFFGTPYTFGLTNTQRVNLRLWVWFIQKKFVTCAGVWCAHKASFLIFIKILSFVVEIFAQK